MEILVIGNGFDLAHGLPTKYSDFLSFVYVIQQVIKENDIDSEAIYWETANSRIEEMIRKGYNDEHASMWQELIEDNIWIDYFKCNKMYQKENWIDFENEISEAIESIDHDMGESDKKLDDKVVALSNEYLSGLFNYEIENMKWLENEENEVLTFRRLRQRLIQDLNKLIRALEIYLCDYVEKMKEVSELPLFKTINPDKIISFNYTNNIWARKID